VADLPSRQAVGSAAPPAILIPALNEAECLARVLPRVPEPLAPGVLVVDGGSTDGTPDVVRRLGFRVIPQEGRGLGRAVVTGIRATTSDVIVVIDGDGSHDVRDIPRMLAKLAEGYDLVVACRYMDGPEDAGMLSPRRRSTSDDDTPIRELGNRALTALCRGLHRVPVHDALNGFKAFRRAVVEAFPIESPGQEYDVEILLKARRHGFRIGEIPIVESRRIAGESKLSAPYHGTLILGVILRELVRRRPQAPDRRP
jgi:glycosyltransferase involved in cell wall biosynthesis